MGEFYLSPYEHPRIHIEVFVLSCTPCIIQVMYDMDDHDIPLKPMMTWGSPMYRYIICMLYIYIYTYVYTYMYNYI